MCLIFSRRDVQHDVSKEVVRCGDTFCSRESDDDWQLKMAEYCSVVSLHRTGCSRLTVGCGRRPQFGGGLWSSTHRKVTELPQTLRTPWTPPIQEMRTPRSLNHALNLQDLGLRILVLMSCGL